MTGFFRRLPLSVKLALVGLIPLCFIVYLTSEIYKEKNKNIERIETYRNRIDEVGKMSDLIQLLGTELKTSFDYLLEKGSAEQLKLARHRTDSTLQLLKASDDELLKDFEEYTNLKSLEGTRKQIDNLQVKPGGIIHTYSSTTFRLNTLTGVTFEDEVLLKKLNNDVQSQKLLTEIETYLSIIRTNIYNILITRAYIPETLMGTFGAYEVYKSYETEFKIKSLPDVTTTYSKIRNETDYKPTVEYIDTLFKTFKLDSTYTPDQWWATSERGLGQLTQLEDKLMNKVSVNMNDIYLAEVSKRDTSILLLCLTIILVVFFLVYTITMISRMLVELRNAAEKIAKGQTGINVNIASKDAIGSLADSIKKVDDNNQQLITAAVEIGKGNFNVNINPRSNDDTLAQAIIKMQQNLQSNIKEIEERELKFRQLADLIPQLVFMTDKDGKSIFLNQQWYDYLGNNSWETAVHPEDKNNAFSAWEEAVNTGNEFVAEYRMQNFKTKQYRWFLARAIPIKGIDGTIENWFGTSTDIHEKKTINENLQKIVDERTIELKRSNEDLLQFAHVTSHDLKEPLRKVHIFTDRLIAELGEDVSEKVKDYLDKIQKAARRQTKLIEGVLEYSKLESPDQVFETLDTNKIINEIITDLEIIIQQKQATINCSKIPSIYGSETLIGQLFYNLLNNALKFTKPGIKPVIDITSTEIVLSATEAKEKEMKEGRYLQVLVTDNGIGFDSSAAEKVFSVFTRLHRNNDYEGTGLGLALCKKIMARHHGYIYATGAEDKGATFYLLFPL